MAGRRTLCLYQVWELALSPLKSRRGSLIGAQTPGNGHGPWFYWWGLVKNPRHIFTARASQLSTHCSLFLRGAHPPLIVTTTRIFHRAISSLTIVGYQKMFNAPSLARSQTTTFMRRVDGLLQYLRSLHLCILYISSPLCRATIPHNHPHNLPILQLPYTIPWLSLQSPLLEFRRHSYHHMVSISTIHRYQANQLSMFLSQNHQFRAFFW